MLDKIKIDDKSYNDYLGYMKEELDNKNQENKEAYSGLLLQLNRTKSAKLTYVKKFM